MVSPNEKDIIRHFLLNVLTVLKVELEELSDNCKKKNKVNDLINTASMIIGNEDIFLGKKPGLFLQDISLNEIIDLSLKINEEEIKNKKIKIKNLDKEHIIRGDRHYLSEAFKHIIEHATQHCKKIEFDFDEKSKTLTLKHDQKHPPINIDEPIAEYLKNKGLEQKAISVKLAMLIFKTHNIDISFEQNSISLKFQN